MRVQEGKKYKMRNGVIVGPMVRYGMYLVHGDTSFLYLEEDVFTDDGVLFEGWRFIYFFCNWFTSIRIQQWQSFIII